MDDGSILRTEALVSGTFTGSGAAGGKIEKIDWNGNVIWSYTLSTTTETQNHDVCPLPNGNILVAVWENMTVAQATAAGRNPAALGASLWSSKIIEIQPSGTSGATIVWQWDLWDHLIQEFDNTKSNFGVVADHPELLNLNFTGSGSSTAVDWIHLNAVTYNADLDQIMFSAHNLSEIYIIDHNTTTAEAASHGGGAHGKGGDFLYRWGNPQSYNRGTIADRKLYLQHNPTWIPNGFKDAGKIMIFNNGNGRPGGNASSVDIIVPTIDSVGNYAIVTGMAYEPATLDWTYMNPTPTSFYAQSMGSAQRLSNGNTLIDAATTGDFFEIDSLKNIVWEYINPVSSTGPITQGTTSATTQVFRSVFYPSSYSAFTGKTLTPGNPIELSPYAYICNLTTGISETNTTADFTLFPNPTSDQFYVRLSAKEQLKSVLVINSFGQTICTTPNSLVDLSEQPVGIYFVRVMTEEFVEVRKVVVK